MRDYAAISLPRPGQAFRRNRSGWYHTERFRVPWDLSISAYVFCLESFHGVTEPRPAGSDNASVASSALVVALPAGRGSVFVLAQENIGNGFLTRRRVWETLKYEYRFREMADPIKPGLIEQR